MREVEMLLVLESCANVAGCKVTIQTDAFDGVGVGIAQKQDIGVHIKLRGRGNNFTAAGSQNLEKK